MGFDTIEINLVFIQCGLLVFKLSFTQSFKINKKSMSENQNQFQSRENESVSACLVVLTICH